MALCLDVAASVQIVFVGVVLLLHAPLRLADNSSIVRTLGLAAIASGLSMLIARSMRPFVAGLSGSPRPVRALRAATSVGVAFAIIGACRLLLGQTGPSSAPLLMWAATSGIFAALLELPRSSEIPVAVVGERDAAAALACNLVGLGGRDRVDVIAILNVDAERDLARLGDLVRMHVARTVIVPANSPAPVLSLLCERLADTPADVMLALSTIIPPSPLCAVLPKRAERMLFLDLLPRPITGRRRRVKRLFDLSIVSILLPLAPLLFLIALAIRLESPGPALFRQWRFGQGSRPILIYKFRTMAVDRGDVTGAARTVARDPRVTRVGRVLRKLSIDELPQVLNVLRGDMSLVGPRPHATHMKVEGAYYFDAVDLYRVRHRMLPGITGWAQVNRSRGEVDTLEKARRRLALDLWYVANWSPALDFWILARTLFGAFVNVRND